MHLRKSVFAWSAGLPGQERRAAYPAGGARRLAELAGRKIVPVISIGEVPLARCAGGLLLQRACGAALRAPSCGRLPCLRGKLRAWPIQKARPERAPLRRKEAGRAEQQIVSSHYSWSSMKMGLCCKQGGNCQWRTKKATRRGARAERWRVELPRIRKQLRERPLAGS